MPANDNFASAQTITGASGHLTFSTVGATTEPGEPANAEGHSVWFVWTPPDNGHAAVRTDSTPLPVWDSYIAVFTGPDLAHLTEIAHDDDAALQSGSVGRFGTSLADWHVVAGTSYWIQVTAWDDVSGPVERSDAVLTWSMSERLNTPNAAAVALDSRATFLPVNIT